MEPSTLKRRTRSEIITLLKGTNRKGIDAVCQYLVDSDYFSARCHSHHRFNGGLAVHSLGVYKEFKKLNPSLSEDSIRIVSLLHDICSSHHPQFNHIGRGHHGLRSVQLLDELGLELKADERNAIARHMHSIRKFPSTGTYTTREMLQHYIHRCDHRDAENYPGGFSSRQKPNSTMYQVDTLLYATRLQGIEKLIDQLHVNFKKLTSNN